MPILLNATIERVFPLFLGQQNIKQEIHYADAKSFLSDLTHLNIEQRQAQLE